MVILAQLLALLIGAGPVLAADDCDATYPAPVIRFDHKDSAGRVYIPVDNRALFPNEMFREAPELPACGANPNSSRTWVDIVDGATDAPVSAFCALTSNSNLAQLWFMPRTGQNKVYVVLKDRACQKIYRSNTVGF